MMDFIEESREAHGVEPICRALQFAPSTYYDRRAIMRDPDRASARAKSDAAMSVKIDAAWDANRKLYGARKIWHVLRRQGEDAAPLSANACIRLSGNGCTVERLMRSLGIRGVVRGKKVITTNPDTSLPCPDDKVNRLFMADWPNKLWVSDFTYLPTRPETPAATAASSLERPAATPCQNRHRFSRYQTGGRPGEHNLRRVDRSDFLRPVAIYTSSKGVLRRPVES